MPSATTAHTDNAALEKEIEELEETVKEKTRGKEDNGERRGLNEQIQDRTQELAEVEKELKVFQRNDPKRVEEMSSLG